MSPLDLPRALLRGRYMAAAARIEWTGIPVDTETLVRLRANWDGIRTRLVAAIDRDYGVFLPTGQRAITSDTRLGTALLETAAQWQIDPYQLAETVEHVWQEARALYAESITARRQARQVTGLTASRINRWENAGRDYSSWPGLDDTAELAGLLPGLGIGSGYSDLGYDDTDYAGRLWELLRDHDDGMPQRHALAILRQAAELVASSLKDGGRYSGPVTFSTRCFRDYLARTGIPWPQLDSGALALDDQTFREMARAYPSEIGPIRELRYALSQLRLSSLAVGADGRNRCLLSAFGSKSSRNQPSNSRYIFGPSCWLRSLIRPEPGQAVAYIDWSQQELAIAAWLSQDPAMIDAYQSGDFYLTFAKMAGAIPATASKATHAAIRDQFKIVALGVLFGLSDHGVARRLGIPLCHGRELLRRHREVFRRFWQWSDQVEVEGMLTGRLTTVFGWLLHTGPQVTPRTLRNFPMQANGAEMMRLACCLATEQGIAVCAVVHDALLVEGPSKDIEDTVARTQAVMQVASGLLLPGFPLRTEAKIVRYPDRYMDPRGERMWKTVHGLLPEVPDV